LPARRHVALDGRGNRFKRGQQPIMDLETLLIIIVAIAVAVLGYLYYESRQDVVRVNLPGVKIGAK
jgi:hypothetical protein